MAARLVLTPEVKQDIAEAYTWYQNQRIGLGEDFLRSIEASFETIRRLPELRAPVHENYRRALVTAISVLHLLRIRENNCDRLLGHSYGA